MAASTPFVYPPISRNLELLLGGGLLLRRRAMDGGERFSQFLRPSGSQSAAVQNKGELAVAVHLQHPPTVAPTALNWCHVVIALGAGGGGSSSHPGR